MPYQTINEILWWNYEDSDSKLWPADTYDSLPDYDGTGPRPQIRLPLPEDWRSPFVGKTIPEVVAFMRNVPKPPKPLNTRFCAILRQEHLAEGCVYICKSLEGEVQQDDSVASDGKADSEIADAEVADDDDDSDIDMGIREGCDPMLAMVLEAEREMIKENRRETRAERLAGNTGKEVDDKTKPKHENDFENVQLIPTSNDMISLFLDGFEHERWDEYFCRWREHQHWIS